MAVAQKREFYYCLYKVSDKSGFEKNGSRSEYFTDIRSFEAWVKKIVKKYYKDKHNKTVEVKITFSQKFL